MGARDAGAKPFNRMALTDRKSGRRLLAATPTRSTLPALSDMSPCVSTPLFLVVILTLLYLLYALIPRRTRAAKRRQSTSTGLHASNPHGIYEPVEPYFDLA